MKRISDLEYHLYTIRNLRARLAKAEELNEQYRGICVLDREKETRRVLEVECLKTENAALKDKLCEMGWVKGGVNWHARATDHDRLVTDILAEKIVLEAKIKKLEIKLAKSKS